MMTPTPPTTAAPAPTGSGVVLHADEAADLAGFLDGSGHGHLAAAGLAAIVEQNALSLHRRLSKAPR
jgi:hypothetical protein